ncbi:MAG: pyridoxal 5'-phosphate synthase glutaminase subunit PdxT [Thermoplasmata archaeon]
MEIGVVDIQGDVTEHVDILERIGIAHRRVRRVEDLDGLSGVIIPGGESTVIGSIMRGRGIDKKIMQLGLPVMGTCAGMILISEKVDGGKGLMPILHIEVKRNGYGSQRESFETDLDIKGIGRFRGVFIRAPVVTAVNRGEVIAEFNGHAVAVVDGKNMGISFHPEIYGDPRIHQYFVHLIKGR